MSTLLNYILSKKRTEEEIEKKVLSHHLSIPLFDPIPALKNKTVFEYLQTYQKIKGCSLETLVKTGAVNLKEKNKDDHTLVQLLIIEDDIYNVRMVLIHGASLDKSDLNKAVSEEMKSLLNYKPGAKHLSILDFCSKRARPVDYLLRVNALILDQQDTTDAESSNAEIFSDSDLSSDDQKKLNDFRTNTLKKYNKSPENHFSDDQLCFVAARGVHFSPKYFKPETLDKVKTKLDSPQNTYSQSTLFDAGYTADDEVDVSDKKIQKRHSKNMAFINKKKTEEDKQERNVGTYSPPASRNKVRFDNLYYRLMQVYINSYSTLFNKGTIISDFGFDTKNNPFVSASWNIEKAVMYASGHRFDWQPRVLRKDPHYRRSTGNPKHPNMGYLDIYVFDAAYVKANGFDRQLMCDAGTLHLSAFYRYEAEIIFPSMIPKKFHNRRVIISLPSFEKPYAGNKGYYAQYGINRKSKYEELKAAIAELPADKKSKDYSDVINLITEKASKTQASTIEQTAHARLFQNPDKSRAVVYDHGTKLAAKPFKIS